MAAFVFNKVQYYLQIALFFNYLWRKFVYYVIRILCTQIFNLLHIIIYINLIYTFDVGNIFADHITVYYLQAFIDLLVVFLDCCDCLLMFCYWIELFVEFLKIEMETNVCIYITLWMTLKILLSIKIIAKRICATLYSVILFKFIPII